MSIWERLLKDGQNISNIMHLMEITTKKTKLNLGMAGKSQNKCIRNENKKSIFMIF
jgi:hypothetical protein